MNDSISRQAAIKALNEQIELCNKALSSFDISMKDEYAVKVEKKSLEAYRETLEALPSAQPEIIRCHECSGFDDETEDDFGSGFCFMWGGKTDANAFCSYAKRG